MQTAWPSFVKMVELWDFALSPNPPPTTDGDRLRKFSEVKQELGGYVHCRPFLSILAQVVYFHTRAGAEGGACFLHLIVVDTVLDTRKLCIDLPLTVRSQQCLSLPVQQGQAVTSLVETRARVCRHTSRPFVFQTHLLT